MLHGSGRGLNHTICTIVLHTVNSAHAVLEELQGASLFNQKIVSKKGTERQAGVSCSVSEEIGTRPPTQTT
jgi:hypothetical protein